MTTTFDDANWLSALAGAYRERVARDGPDADDPDAEREMLAHCERLAERMRAAWEAAEVGDRLHPVLLSAPTADEVPL